LWAAAFGAAFGQRAAGERAEAIAGSGVRIDAGVGYGRVHPAVKSDLWHPIWIEIESTQRDISGRVVISQTGARQVVEVPFSVARGTKKRLQTRFRIVGSRPSLNGPNIEIRVEARFGRSTFTLPVDYASLNSRNTLVIGEEYGPLGTLSRRVEATFNDPAPRETERFAIVGEVDRLPDDALGLDPLDAIVFTGPQIARLTPAQADALRDWTAWGGTLMVMGGAHQSFVRQSPLHGAFGIELTPPEGARWGDIVGDETAGEDADRGVLVSWPKGEWDSILIGSAEHPYLVEKRFGEGRFLACASPLETNFFGRFNIFGFGEEFWQATLDRRSRGGPMRRAADEAETRFGVNLQGGFGVDLAPLAKVLGFLLLYHILAIPLNWWVCRRFRRAEWSWAGAIALGLIFAGFGWRWSAGRRTADVQVHEITLATRSAPGTSARATSVAAIFSPDRLSRSIELGSHALPAEFPVWMVAPQYRGGSVPVLAADGQVKERVAFNDLYALSPLGLTLGARPRIDNFFLHPGSARNLRSDFAIDPQIGVEAVGEISVGGGSGGGPSGEIVNRTPWTFHTWFVSANGATFKSSAAIEPGGSARLESATPILEGATDPASIAEVYFLASSSDDGRQDDPAVAMALSRRGLTNLARWQRVTPAENGSGDVRFLGVASGAMSPTAAAIGPGRSIAILLYEELSIAAIRRESRE
jgi:hypothetical protein